MNIMNKFILLQYVFISIFCQAEDIRQPLTQILVKKNSHLLNPHKRIIAKSVKTGYHEFILNSEMWIDKSAIIEKLLTAEKNKIHIVTGPQGWGKTMTLNLIEFFFKIPISSSGHKTDRKSSPSYRYFLHGEIIDRKNGVKIAETNELPLIKDYPDIENYICQHPVIHMSGEHLEFKNGISSLRTLVGFSYRQNAYLVTKMTRMRNSSIISNSEVDEDIKLFNSYSTDLIQNKTDDAVLQGISELCRLLLKYFGKKVIILYDDSDAYIRKIHFDEIHKPSSDAEEIPSFLERFMTTTLKQNQYLKTAVITGVLSIHQATYLPRIDNSIKILSVFNLDNFYPFFGVHDYEFSEMMKYRGINETVQKIITDWYDGYRDMDHLQIPIYSMNSITEFVNELNFGSYRGLSNFRPSFEHLLQQKEFFEDYKQIRNIFDDNDALVIRSDKLLALSNKDCKIIHKILTKEIQYQSSTHIDIFFSFMTMIGLVAVKSRIQDRIELKIANKEILNEFLQIESNVVKTRFSEIPSFDEIKKNLTEFIHNTNDDEKIVKNLATSLNNYFLEMIKSQKSEFIQSLENQPQTKTNSGNSKISAIDTLSTLMIPEGIEELLELRHGKSIKGEESTIQIFLIELFSNAMELNNVSFIAPQFDFMITPIGCQITDNLPKTNVTVIMEMKYADKNQSESEIDPLFEQCILYTYIFKNFELSPSVIFVKYVAVLINHNYGVHVKVRTIFRNEVAEILKSLMTECTIPNDDQGNNETITNVTNQP